MSQSWFQDVIAFHRAIGHPVGVTPKVPIDWTECRLARDLIDEEYGELVHALETDDLPGIADGAIDLIWVTLSALARYGIDPADIWRAVDAANMTKATGPVLPSGKRGKPPGFVPPDVAGVLARQGPIGGGS